MATNLPTLPTLGTSTATPAGTTAGSDWFGSNNPVSHGLDAAGEWFKGEAAALGGVLKNAASPTASETKDSSSILGFSISRIAAMVVGIIAIAAGLLMFRQTQTVIQVAGKAAAKGAEIAA